MGQLVPQSMRRYISSKSENKLYCLLDEIISEESCWKNIDDNDLKEMKAPEDPTYPELIGKTFDELSYSNLIAYYLKYNSNVYYRFLNEPKINFKYSDSTPTILGNNEYSITREKTIKCEYEVNNVNGSKDSKSLSGRVDIYIEGRYKDKEFLILIENKNKSGIKGTRDEKATQLDLYSKFIQEKLEENSELACSLVLLVPDYYESTHPEFSQSKNRDYFEVVCYSDLYDFFERNSAEYKEAPYFEDFKRCLNRQTESEGQAIYNIMKDRFIYRIIQVSKEKNKAK